MGLFDVLRENMKPAVALMTRAFSLHISDLKAYEESITCLQVRIIMKFHKLHCGLTDC